MASCGGEPGVEDAGADAGVLDAGADDAAAIDAGVDAAIDPCAEEDGPGPVVRYVATSGDDGASGRGPGCAWATLERAERAIEELGPRAAGSVVSIGPGRYTPGATLVIRASGTLAAPITWRGDPVEGSIVDGQAEAMETGRFLLLVEASHRVFENLVWERSAFDAVAVRGDDNVFVHNTARASFGMGFNVYRGRGNRFEHCLARDNCDTILDEATGRIGGYADGFAFSGVFGDMGVFDPAYANVARFCVALGNGDDGFDAFYGIGDAIEHSIAIGNGYTTRRGGLEPAGDGTGIKGGSLEASGTLVRNSLAAFNRVVGFNNNGGSLQQWDYVTAIGNGAQSFRCYLAPAARYRSRVRNAIAFGSPGIDLEACDATTSTFSLGLTLGEADFVSSTELPREAWPEVSLPGRSAYDAIVATGLGRLAPSSAARGVGTELGSGTDLGWQPSVR